MNPKRLELARTMGAHDAVHPDDAKAAVMKASDGNGADVVLEMLNRYFDTRSRKVTSVSELLRQVAGQSRQVSVPLQP